MDPGTVSRIEEWDTQPFTGGYAGIHQLAATDFTGVIHAGNAWLFMLNGQAVGVVDGSIAAFENTDGAAYESPHPALPLLFTMQAQGGETQARYYTDDTPLETVNQTLTDGNFTGYVELSENVLSGDYYLVFHAGRSMSVAFLGSAERLITDDEAFQQANDEVGIYEVRSVDLEVLEVPEPTDETDARTDVSPSEIDDSAPSSDTVDQITDAESSGTIDDVTEPDSPTAAEEPTDTAEASESSSARDLIESAADAVMSGDPDEEPTTGSEPEPEPSDTTPTDDEIDEAEPEQGSEPADTPEPTPDHDESTAASDQQAAQTDAAGDPFEEEEAWRKTRTIPALDPDESDVDRPVEPDGTEPVESPAETEPATSEPDSPEPQQAETESQASPESQESTDTPNDRMAKLEAALAEQESMIETLESRLESATDERESLRSERKQLVNERDALREQLNASGDTTGEPAGDALTSETALSQTDLFVRYGSKGKATLEKAHGGEVDREAVNGNLRLEKHTRFEADAATVGGVPFSTFLDERIEYRFVRWVIEDLLYEIRDTNSERQLRDLYDTLPNVDRAEFLGTITVTDEDEEDHEESFDIIFRDRMGSPLLVANVNDARDPATSAMMDTLLESTTGVAEAHDTICGTFLVTASFFEPGALETAEVATKGGFLNRESRASFVKLSRKRGYHLCLVEARGGEFHVAVPDL